MKANQAFKADTEAVSPVIGVILMVAITVVLAAVVFVLVTKLSSGNSEKSPQLSLAATADNEADDIVIKHQTGEALTGGEFQVSVQPVGQNPSYLTCDGPLLAPATKKFEAGFQLRVSHESDGTGADCDIDAGTLAATSAVLTGSPAGNKYQVLVRHVSSGTVLIDNVVTIL